MEDTKALVLKCLGAFLMTLGAVYLLNKSSASVVMRSPQIASPPLIVLPGAHLECNEDKYCEVTE